MPNSIGVVVGLSTLGLAGRGGDDVTAWLVLSRHVMVAVRLMREGDEKVR